MSRRLGLLFLGFVAGVAVSFLLISPWVHARQQHFRLALVDVIENRSTHVHPPRSEDASFLQSCNLASDLLRLENDKMYAGFVLNVGLHRALADEIATETYDELSVIEKMKALAWGPDEAMLRKAHERAKRTFRNSSRALAVADWAKNCGL